MPPRKRKPADSGVTGDALRTHYVEWAREEGVDLDPSDHALIERLVTATDIARDLEASIAREGAVVTVPVTGNEKPNPALSQLRGQIEMSAKLITALDKRIADAAADTPPNRGGVQPFAVRGPYDKGTGTDGATATAIRKPARTRPQAKGGRRHGA